MASDVLAALRKARDAQAKGEGREEVQLILGLDNPPRDDKVTEPVASEPEFQQKGDRNV